MEGYNILSVIKEVTNVFHNLGAGADDLTGTVVHDQIEITLTETLLLVLETVVLGRNGVQAWRQKNEFSGEDGQLTVIAVLG